MAHFYHDIVSLSSFFFNRELLVGKMNYFEIMNEIVSEIKTGRK